MNPASKEIEIRGVTQDEQALKEVDGYIERIEKQAENPTANQGLQHTGTATPPPSKVTDDMGKVIMQAVASQGRPKIVLPLDEEGIKRGLHHKIYDAMRWLAEWSILMIRKYPGRVFYK